MLPLTEFLTQLQVYWPWLAAIGAGILVGALLALLFMRNKAKRLQLDNDKLNLQLTIEKERHLEKLAAIEESRTRLADTFSRLSQQALKDNSDSFLKLANENLRQFQSQAEFSLEKKEKAIEVLLKPIETALKKTETQIQELEKDRRQAFGSLSEHLKLLNDSQIRLQTETQNLVHALRRPEVRGQWGELTLKRIVELAGMNNYCDFYEQLSVDSEERRHRPDMIVRMPDQRELIVDAKTPLDAYLNATQLSDRTESSIALKAHAKNVRNRIKELASKTYWAQFKNSPDFVILFIPGEQFLSSALEIDPSLFEEAVQNRVILATPTTLIALLRAVAFGWRQYSVARNAEKIRELGEELYRQLASFGGHLQLLGKNLDQSVQYYNKAINSLEKNVLTGARKFEELGIQGKTEIPALRVVEKQANNKNG